MKNISYFNNIRQTKDGSVKGIDHFLIDVKNGTWINEIIAYRNNEPVDFPYVTISGEFTHRSIKGLKEHSGFICMDIDDIDPDQVKSIICPDRYVYAAFASRSGKGLAVLFKINPKKHSESFDGLSQYLFEHYQVVVDPACRDVSRARFVSYDPNLYLNEASEKFAIYPQAEPPALKKLPQAVFVQNDFDAVVDQIVSRRIDLTSSYSDWLHIGFSIADKFGESGRSYFHAVSQFHPKYRADLTDKQYTNCCKAGKTGRTIGTFYYFCKQAGINTVSERTKLISLTASQAKKGARSKGETVKLLEDLEGIPQEESYPIIDQVYDNNINIESEDSIISEVELWLRQNYDFKRNAITRKIDCNNRPMESRDFNTIYLGCRKVIDKVNFDTVDRIINSDFTPDYNPFLDFFDKYKDRKPDGNRVALIDSIKTDTGVGVYDEYKFHFISKWLLGIVASMLGNHSPLMLVLSGTEGNTGKTEFFRRLLPPELKAYYAESKLDAGKDDELLMCQKLLIMDDELSGKSKKETARIKELTSKDIFSLREPYGRHNIDLKRIAVLGGTTNESQVIHDPTGNRRIIPVNVLSIDHAMYNSVDKVDLIMEMYHLFNQGFDHHLERDDIQILKQCTGNFEATSAEYDLLNRYFEPAPAGSFGVEFLTNTDIKSKLEMWSGQKLNHIKLGIELKKLGFDLTQKKIKGKPQRGYYVLDNSKKVAETSF